MNTTIDGICQDALFFFDGRPHALSLYAAFARRALKAFPGTEIRVQKTQISFYDGQMYACISMTPVRPRAERPAHFITVSFGLDMPLDDPRAIPAMVRPNRWTHHVVIGDAAEIDDALMKWIARSHAISSERKRRHA